MNIWSIRPDRCLSVLLWSVLATTPTPPRLHVDGKHLVDSAGTPVHLKGVNLGNWLVIETWMLRWENVPDQFTILEILTDRFGRSEAERLISIYRDNYITPRDFELIKSFGFNVVRIPFAWDLFQLDVPPYTLKPDAFKYLDRACEMAQDAGLYVILDLHGAPGGQSKEHHTYREKQNKLFRDESNIQRTEEIWRALARHFKNRSNIVAYDLVNEPYGDYKQDVRADLAKLMERLYKVIRAEDPKTLILFPGTLQGDISFYGNPRDKGMTNVGFTEHFYPGLFGDKPEPASHYRTINGRFAERLAYLDKMQVPYLVGEFNVVLDKAGGDGMMRRYYDIFETNDWLCTAWTYKLLKPQAGASGDNWYFVTNADALPKLDIRTASKTAIEEWFRNLCTMKLAVDESLRAALTSATSPPITAPPTTSPN